MAWLDHDQHLAIILLSAIVVAVLLTFGSAWLWQAEE
jgi:hypothetical protein